MGGGGGIKLGNPIKSITSGGGGLLNSGKGMLSNFTGGMIGGQGQNANTLAYDQQAQGIGQANQAVNEAYDTQKGLYNPYIEAGTKSLGNITSGNIQMDPGYQFRLGEGMKGINSSLASRGMGNSGAALKALQRYGQDYATGEYGNAFNRQMQVAQMGQGSSTNLANAAQNRGVTLGNNYMGLGNAGAAREMGKANQQAGFIDRMYSNVGTGMGMASDARVKTNIQSVNAEDFAEMKKALKPYVFNYLNDQYGTGDWVGVMAQDLEKSKLGRTVIETNDKGHKIVNLTKLNSIILASIAEG